MRTPRTSQDADGGAEIVGFADAGAEDRPALGGPGAAYHVAFELCAALPGGGVVAVGWLCDPGGAVSALSLVDDAGAALPGQAALRHERPDIRRRFDLLNDAAQCGFVIVAVPDGPPPNTARLHLAGRLGSGEMAVPVEDGATDFAAFLSRLATLFDAETRLTLFELAVRAGVVDGLGALERQRLIGAWNRSAAECPSEISDPITATWLHVDTATQLASYGVMIVGWANSGRRALQAVDLIQVGGGVRRVSDEWVAMDRPDVIESLRADGTAMASDAPGFLFVAPVSEPVAQRLVYFAATFADGRMRRARLDPTPSPSDTLAVVRSVLTRFHDGERRLIELLDRQIGPAVGALWHARPTSAPAASVLTFGTPPRDPEVSVIVPIYGRYDFIEFQIALFVDDPEMRRAELVYVIDDPSIYDRVRRFCTEIAPIYEFPFTVLYQGCNSGFAGANNFGARAARGRKLLLLNSDVFPCAPGWLSELIAAYDRLPHCGAAAPKLIYEDNSIQHAGIAFVRHPPWGGLWINDHPRKGQPDDGAREPVEHPALTAACLLIDRGLYRRVGGFSEDYIVGDFEDTDLCLKLRAIGRRNWLVPAVRLYHLERQSQARGGDAFWRGNLSLYNCWLHNARWGATIARLGDEAPLALAGDGQ